MQAAMIKGSILQQNDLLYVAYCEHCGEINAMSIDDDDFLEWPRYNRSTGILVQEVGDRPKWCGCGATVEVD